MGEARENQRDSVFRILFKDKKKLLNLYNAVNGSDYSDPEELEITTLENAVYLGMKNDLSFLIGLGLNIYEHQGSINENMPLRILFYVSQVFQRLTATENLHGSKQVLVPEPQFIVFYNGKTKRPEKYEMLLSDAYQKKSESPVLELRVTVYNINKGYNQELMDKCPELKEYMLYCEKLREYCKTEELDAAVEKTVDECIKEGILKKFLMENKAEVKAMTIFEFDYEEHIRSERAYAKEEGREEGREEAREEIVISMLKNKLSPEDICLYTNVPLEDIKRIEAETFLCL